MSGTREDIMIGNLLADLLGGQDLDAGRAESLMHHAMSGELGEARLGAVLAALCLRRVTAAELSGLARAMRAHAVPVTAACADRAVDTCGTGGDGRGTFNISTAAAIVTAAAGVPVAKHGNRAASSRCGSADVLEALGLNLELGPDALGRVLDELGIAFLFAPRHHPAMRHAMPVRRALGVRTVFNLLGPLTNPARVRRQLLGVYAPELTDLIANALAGLECERALVVHGLGGEDEISLTGETAVSELRDGRVLHYTVTPEDAGLDRCANDQLAGGDPDTNARLISDVLDGNAGPRTDAVLLNAGGALMAAGVVEHLRDGVERARAAVRDGRARRLLHDLRAASHDLADSTANHEAGVGA